MKKLNIIWLGEGNNFDAKNFWEYGYLLTDLFSLFDINFIQLSDSYDVYLDNALLIYSCDTPNLDSKYLNYFSEYKKRGLKYNLYHLSNEQLNHNYSYYADAKVVFRNYPDIRIKYPNVFTVPLGYKTGFVNKNKNPKKFNEKKYDFNFIGALKWDRFMLVEFLKKQPRTFIHTISRWAAPESLPTEKMQEILEDTLLVPCPMGNVLPETFRFYETLESGSIPVIKRYNNFDYYSMFYIDHPFPVVDEWTELPSVLDQLKKQNVDDIILNINSWYDSYKKNYRSAIYSLL